MTPSLPNDPHPAVIPAAVIPLPSHASIWFRTLLACALAALLVGSSFAANISFSVTNYDGTPVTNDFIVRPVGDPAVDANGNISAAIGLPSRIHPQSDGRATNWFQAGNYFVTNAPGPNFLGKGYVFRAPQDSGPTIYPAAGPGQLITGLNYFVTLFITNGTGGALTFNAITNALGLAPLGPTATNIVETSALARERANSTALTNTLNTVSVNLSNTVFSVGLAVTNAVNTLGTASTNNTQRATNDLSASSQARDAANLNTATNLSITIGLANTNYTTTAFGIATNKTETTNTALLGGIGLRTLTTDFLSASNKQQVDLKGSNVASKAYADATFETIVNSQSITNDIAAWVSATFLKLTIWTGYSNTFQQEFKDTNAAMQTALTLKVATSDFLVASNKQQADLKATNANLAGQITAGGISAVTATNIAADQARAATNGYAPTVTNITTGVIVDYLNNNSVPNADFASGATAAGTASLAQHSQYPILSTGFLGKFFVGVDVGVPPELSTNGMPTIGSLLSTNGISGNSAAYNPSNSFAYRPEFTGWTNTTGQNYITATNQTETTNTIRLAAEAALGTRIDNASNVNATVTINRIAAATNALGFAGTNDTRPVVLQQFTASSNIVVWGNPAFSFTTNVIVIRGAGNDAANRSYYNGFFGAPVGTWTNVLTGSYIKVITGAATVLNAAGQTVESWTYSPLPDLVPNTNITLGAAGTLPVGSHTFGLDLDGTAIFTHGHSIGATNTQALIQNAQTNSTASSFNPAALVIITNTFAGMITNVVQGTMASTINAANSASNYPAIASPLTVMANWPHGQGLSFPHTDGVFLTNGFMNVGAGTNGIFHGLWTTGGNPSNLYVRIYLDCGNVNPTNPPLSKLTFNAPLNVLLGVRWAQHIEDRHTLMFNSVAGGQNVENLEFIGMPFEWDNGCLITLWDASKNRPSDGVFYSISYEINVPSGLPYADYKPRTSLLSGTNAAMQRTNIFLSLTNGAGVVAGLFLGYDGINSLGSTLEANWYAKFNGSGIIGWTTSGTEDLFSDNSYFSHGERYASPDNGVTTAINPGSQLGKFEAYRQFYPNNALYFTNGIIMGLDEAGAGAPHGAIGGDVLAVFYSTIAPDPFWVTNNTASAATDNTPYTGDVVAIGGDNIVTFQNHNNFIIQFSPTNINGFLTLASSPDYLTRYVTASDINGGARSAFNLFSGAPAGDIGVAVWTNTSSHMTIVRNDPAFLGSGGEMSLGFGFGDGDPFYFGENNTSTNYEQYDAGADANILVVSSPGMTYDATNGIGLDTGLKYSGSGSGLTNISTAALTGFFVSTNITMPSGVTQISLAHHLGHTPFFAQLYLVCVVADSGTGCQVGEQVETSSVWNNNSAFPQFTLIPNTTNVVVSLNVDWPTAVSDGDVLINTRVGGGTASPTAATNFKLKIVAW